jgi:hypothetical protein
MHDRHKLIYRFWWEIMTERRPDYWCVIFILMNK